MKVKVCVWQQLVSSATERELTLFSLFQAALDKAIESIEYH